MLEEGAIDPATTFEQQHRDPEHVGELHYRSGKVIALRFPDVRRLNNDEFLGETLSNFAEAGGQCVASETGEGTIVEFF